jgi:hypothetical protein
MEKIFTITFENIHISKEDCHKNSLSSLRKKIQNKVRLYRFLNKRVPIICETIYINVLPKIKETIYIFPYHRMSFVLMGRPEYINKVLVIQYQLDVIFKPKGNILNLLSQFA